MQTVTLHSDRTHASRSLSHTGSKHLSPTCLSVTNLFIATPEDLGHASLFNPGVPSKRDSGSLVFTLGALWGLTRHFVFRLLAGDLLLEVIPQRRLFDGQGKDYQDEKDISLTTLVLYNN